VAGIVELHETDAVPLEVNDVWVIAPQLSPDGAVSVSARVPVNPCMKATLIVDVEDEPRLTDEGDEALIVKSGGIPNVNETIAV
jgi:hypothetical protein